MKSDFPDPIRATPNDAPVVHSLLLALAHQAREKGLYQPDWLFDKEGMDHILTTIREHDLFFVPGNETAAASIWFKYEDWENWGDAGMDQTSGYIHGFGVRPDLQGGGIGSKLLNWAEAYLLNSRKSYARLECDPADEPLHRFYEKRGYVQVQPDEALSSVMFRLYQKKLLNRPRDVRITG